MQILTAQYPTLYTHKFKVSYNDFKPSTTFANQFDLLTIAKTVQVVHTQIYCITPFAGSGLTSATIRLFDKAQLPSASLTTGQFGSCVVLGTQSSIMGSSQWVQPRARVTAPTTQSIICNTSAPTTISCRFIAQTGYNITLLSAGEVYIWITTMKLP